MQFGAERLRVLFEGPGADQARPALADHVIDEPADLGFVVQAPKDGSRLHLLLDRSGLILARARSTAECVSMLGRHLAVFVPPPRGTSRFRLRALLRQDMTVALAAFPLFTDPPLIERRLEKAGHRMIDRLAVDLRPDGTLDLSPSPWPELAGRQAIDGHAPAPDGPCPVDAVLMPQLGSPATAAMVIQAVAAGGSPVVPVAERVEIAAALAATRIVSVPLDDRSARYRALED